MKRLKQNLTELNSGSHVEDLRSGIILSKILREIKALPLFKSLKLILFLRMESCFGCDLVISYCHQAKILDGKAMVDFFKFFLVSKNYYESYC